MESEQFYRDQCTALGYHPEGPWAWYGDTLGSPGQPAIIWIGKGVTIDFADAVTVLSWFTPEARQAIEDQASICEQKGLLHPVDRGAFLLYMNGSGHEADASTQAGRNE